jgi:hypothetical protein
VTMKKTMFWYIMPCGSCKNRRFGGTYRLHHEGDKNWRARNNASSNQQPKHAAHIVFLCSVLRLLVTASVVPSSLFLLTLMIEAIRSPEMSVLAGATRRNIAEDGILQAEFCLLSASPSFFHLENCTELVLGLASRPRHGAWPVKSHTLRLMCHCPIAGTNENLHLARRAVFVRPLYIVSCSMRVLIRPPQVLINSRRCLLCNCLPLTPSHFASSAENKEQKHPVPKYRPCGLVVRFPGYRSRGSGFDSRRYYIF